jgi:hypothetical protein
MTEMQKVFDEAGRRMAFDVIGELAGKGERP